VIRHPDQQAKGGDAFALVQRVVDTDLHYAVVKPRRRPNLPPLQEAEIPNAPALH